MGAAASDATMPTAMSETEPEQGIEQSCESGDVEGSFLTDDVASLIALKVSGGYLPCNNLPILGNINYLEKFNNYGTCFCKEQNGNNNLYQCTTLPGTGDYSHHPCQANCPSNCQCTAGGFFSYADRANFCHGGSECP